MMSNIDNLKTSVFLKKILALGALSLFLSASFLFLVLTIFPKTRFFDNFSIYAREAYFLNFIFFILILGVSFYLSIQSDLKKFLNSSFKYILSTLFLPEIIVLTAIWQQVDFKPQIPVISAIYIIILGLYISFKLLPIEKTTDLKKGNISRKNKFDYFFIFTLLLCLVSYGYFSMHNIGKFAAVDEALWTFDRIPNFWRDINESDWKNARVSDKPGFTIAMISGIGLLSEESPKKFKKATVNNSRFNVIDFENFNKDFRLPIVLFIILMLPLFYFFTKSLFGKNAAILFSIFLATSPIIIGNSRIINPDSILWVFVPLSLILFLNFLESQKTHFVYLSGLFLGLALLTKYTANILFPFIFLLIPFYYIFNQNKNSFETYFKKSLKAYAVFAIISLITFFLYPAVWEKPDRLFLGTIHSQAFESVWPLFAGAVIFVLFDLGILQGKIIFNIINFFKKFDTLLMKMIFSFFSLSIILVLINVYIDFKIFNFEKILASPKSSHAFAGYPGLFLADFYPMIFGISALVFCTIFIFSIFNLFFKKIISKEQRISLALVLFILTFYIGSAVTHVALTIRYQVVIFPIALLLAAIAFNAMLKNIQNHFLQKIIILLIFIFSLTDLKMASSSFDDYASFLLPQKHFLNIKDMGSGSYEAAIFLNTLPNASNLKIWTDKNGVCTFFEGQCFTSMNFEVNNKLDVDFMILSSGRKSRSEAMLQNKNIFGKNISYWYNSNDHIWKLNLNNRPNNYVKIIPLPKY